MLAVKVRITRSGKLGNKYNLSVRGRLNDTPIRSTLRDTDGKTAGDAVVALVEQTAKGAPKPVSMGD